MKFESAIVYRMPVDRNEMYIRSFYEALNIKEFYRKEVKKMGVLDLEKIEAWGADLLAKIEEEKAVKLANREKIVAERVAEFERKLRETIDDELVAEVNAKYAHDIELFERFRKDEVAGEEVLEENTEIEGE